jgi:alkylation response protein AidB-like acyl-CoA dehydrogenase
LIDLALTSEQETLRESFSALFERSAGLDLVRQVEDLGFSPRLWQQVGSLGAVDMAVPERSGGGGAGLVDAALVAELAGRHLAPVPIFESVVANRLLARLADEETEASGLAAEILERVLASGLVTTIALHPAQAGLLRWVPGGAVADVVLAADGPSVVAIEGAAPGVALANLGSLPVAHRGFDRPRRVGSGSRTVAAWAESVDEWRVLAAAWLDGAGRRSLELAVAYTSERKAFGVPIASYQSVAHRLADLATALDGADLLHRKAAWAADTRSDRAHELALMAFAFSSETAEAAASEALHFHGGYGFMLEYDIQLYLRKIKAVALQAGPQAALLQSLADELWGTPTRPTSERN